jgi:hypothetical protein
MPYPGAVHGGGLPKYMRVEETLVSESTAA